MGGPNNRLQLLQTSHASHKDQVQGAHKLNQGELWIEKKTLGEKYTRYMF